MVAIRTPAETVKADSLPEKTPSRGRGSATSRERAPGRHPSPKSGRRNQNDEGAPSVADGVEPVDVLEDLARVINAKHDQFATGLRNTLTLAIELGGLLVNVKDQLPHGDVQCWLEDHRAFCYESAAIYMRVHERREAVGQIDPAKMQPAADLTLKGALNLLAKPRPRAAKDDVAEKPDQQSAPASPPPRTSLAHRLRFRRPAVRLRPWRRPKSTTLPQRRRRGFRPRFPHLSRLLRVHFNGRG